MVENQPIVDNLTGMAERVDGAMHIDGTNIEDLLDKEKEVATAILNQRLQER